MSFPDNDLEAALQGAQSGRTSVDEFVRVLLASTVLVPVRHDEDGAVSLPTVTHGDDVLLAVFTSREQAAKGAPRQQEWANPPVAEILGQLPPEVGLAVNIGGDVGLPIAAGLLAQARGGATTVTPGPRIRIGEPTVEPNRLLNAVSEALAAVPAARSARRAWAQVDQNSPGLVIGIDVDPDNPDTRQAILAAVDRAVAGYAANPDPETTEALGVGFRVDVVFTTERDSLVDWMRANAKPFHQT